MVGGRRRPCGDSSARGATDTVRPLSGQQSSFRTDTRIVGGLFSFSPGLNARTIKVDARRHLLEDETRYYDLAELGYVPLLQLDDGTFLREGPVIAQYLADQRPETGLAPAYGTIERYRSLEWLNFLTSEVHKGFIPLLYAVAAGKWVDAARPKLEGRYEWINRQLAGKQFLMGDDFTIADAHLFALTRWGKATWMRSVYNERGR
jgi:glutathione S-transferase